MKTRSERENEMSKRHRKIISHGFVSINALSHSKQVKVLLQTLEMDRLQNNLYSNVFLFKDFLHKGLCKTDPYLFFTQ